MGKKASDTGFKPHEVEALARQQNRMNNPNVTNAFGSTTTQFGADDQAQINQTLSAPMQGIVDGMMDFVGQGPAQTGQYSNPLFENLIGNTAQALGRIGGYDAYQGEVSQPSPHQMPTYNAPQLDDPIAQGSQAGSPISQALGRIGGAAEQNPFQAIGQSAGGYANNGGHPFSQMIQNWQQRPQSQPINYQIGG